MPDQRSREMPVRAAAAALVLLVASGASGVATSIQEREDRQRHQSPILQRTLRPCCSPTSAGVPAEMLRAPLRPVERPVPEGEVLPEEQIEALKRQVRRRPEDLVRGQELDAVAEWPPEVAGAAPSSAPTRVRNKFTGLDRASSEGLGFVYFPSDANVAVGPEDWVQGTNSAFALVGRGGAGGERPERRLISSMNEHWGRDEEPFHFDPRVLYDAESGRFFLTSITLDESPRRSFIWVSVSRSSTPEDLGGDSWCNYRIRGKHGASWADFPSTGVNRDWYVVTANNFRFANDSYKRPFLYALDKRQLVDNATSCPTMEMFVFRPGRDPDGSRPFTIQPARHLDRSEPGVTPPGRVPLYLVHAQCCGRSDQYGLWELQGDGDSRPELQRLMVTGSGYAIPPNAPQKGGGTELDTDVQRVQSAVFRNGSLYFTHTTACQQGAGNVVSCIRIGRITPSPRLQRADVQDWTFGHGPRRYLWMPGVAVNAAGDILSVFQIAGRPLFLGVGMAGLAAGDEAFGDVRTLRRGNQNQECVGGGIRNRTGDYVGVGVDPLDDSGFVATGQFNDKRVGFDSTCNWNTIIGTVDVQ